MKDAFHRYVIHGDKEAVNPEAWGTKAAAYYRTEIAAGGMVELRFRSVPEGESAPVNFDAVFSAIERPRPIISIGFERTGVIPIVGPVEMRVARNALASLLWSKQFYQFGVLEWLEGDPASPPAAR